MQQTDYFVFPFKFMDLMNESPDNRYRITEEINISKIDERQIKRSLNEIEKALYDSYSQIMKPEKFDFLYEWIHFLEENKQDFAMELLEQTADILSTTLEKLLKAMEEELPEDLNVSLLNNEDQQMIDDLRNSFKMVVFLLFFFLHNTCLRKTKGGLSVDLTEAQRQMHRGVGANQQPNHNHKKKNAAKSNNNMMDPQSQERLLIRQRGLVEQLHETLAQDFKPLWNKRAIDDEFYKYFVQMALRMLESKPLLQLKSDPAVQKTLFQILEYVLVEKPDAFKNVQLKLINIVYEDETVVEPIAQFVVSAYKSEKVNMVKLATETLTMLVTYIMEKTNLNNETGAIKNTKDFLCRVCQDMPKVFYNNLSSFMCLYDSESYTLRNALSEILTQIIKQVLTNNNNQNNQGQMQEEEDFESQQNHIQMKKRLLERLIKRVYDKHAYARSNILGLLQQLCEENVVPADFLQPVLRAACDRLRDVSANVRKKALQLLRICIDFNFALFVASQKKHKFLTKQQIDTELMLNNQELDTIKAELAQIDVQLHALNEEDVDEYDNLMETHKQQKRRMELGSQIRDKYLDYLAFLKHLDKSLPDLIALLGSKNTADVLETIRLMLVLHQTGIQGSEQGVRKLLVLVWSKDKTVKEEVLRAYWNLYLNDKELDYKTIAANLVRLLNKATLTEATSLEELLITVIKWNKLLDDKDRDKKRNLFYFHDNVYKGLWEFFSRAFNKGQQQNSNEQYEEARFTMRAALQLLRMVASKKMEAVTVQMESFHQILESFQSLRAPDWFVVKEIAIILFYDNTQPAPDKPRQHRLVKSLITLLIRHQGTADPEWFCACEAIVNTIFAIKKSPEVLIQYLILKCSTFLFQHKLSSTQLQLTQQQSLNKVVSPNSNNNFNDQNVNLQYPNDDDMLVNEQQNTDNINNVNNNNLQLENDALNNLNFEDKLAQLLFVVGHGSLKFLLLVDDIEQNLKKMKNQAEGQYAAKQKESAEGEDLDRIHGGIEAEFDRRIEELHAIPEHYLLLRHNQQQNQQQIEPLLSYYTPIVRKIALDILEKRRTCENNALNRTVALTLCKFMVVSKQYCTENMDVLLGFLEMKGDPIIKTNILISLGDLIHRHPNVIQPYCFHLYRNLRDSDVEVRKTTLMVLTHLILNDMLKLKAEISDVALLFDDEDVRIQNLVKLFFHELHKKDNKLIYNLLPEAIGRLSGNDVQLDEEDEFQQDNGNNTKQIPLQQSLLKQKKLQVSEDTFVVFAKNIMAYLEKDKYSETLVDKLCIRFKHSKNPKEWKNTAVCLSLLAYNEKGVRKLLELFECYREKLADPKIMDSFKQILSKLKKAQKPEIKNMVDEWEAKLLNYTTETADQRLSKKKPIPTQNEQSQMSANANNSNTNVKKPFLQKRNLKKGGANANHNNNHINNNKKKKKNDFIEDSEGEEQDDADDYDEVQQRNSNNKHQKKGRTQQQQVQQRRQEHQQQQGQGGGRVLRDRGARRVNMMEIEDDEGDNEDVIEGDIMDDDDEAYHQ